MAKIIIADLVESKTLDREAMATVRGGMSVRRSLLWGPVGDRFIQVDPTQAVSQFQGVENSVGNNVANFGFFDVRNTNTQNQNAQNNVKVGGIFH